MFLGSLDRGNREAKILHDLLQNIDEILGQLDVELPVDLGEGPRAFAMLLELVIVNLRQLDPGSSNVAGLEVGGVNPDDPRSGRDQRSRQGKDAELHGFAEREEWGD